MHDLLSEIKKFRSHSQEKIRQPSNPRRSNSSHSVDLFSLVIPPEHGASLSSLYCSICSLPMTKPTILPCQHTFCLKCLQNTQQVRPGSLPIHCADSLSSNDHRITTITCPKCQRMHRIHSLTDLEQNQSVQLLVNTLLCQTCYQLYPPNQIDTCLHCFGGLCPNCYEQHIANHQNDLKTSQNCYRPASLDDAISIPAEPNVQKKDPTFGESPKPSTFEKKTITKPIVETANNDHQNVDPVQPTNTKQKSKTFFRRLINPIQHRHSANEIDAKPSPPSVKRSASAKLPRRPKMVVEIKMDDAPTVESHPLVVPITPVSRFVNFNELYIVTAERIKQYKQRQSELDRSVQKLVEVLTMKSNETINQISQYWSYLKQFSLEQLETKSNRFQLLGYLLQTCCGTLDDRKQMTSYFEQNDEIKAALQVLLTTLIIVTEQQSHASINQSFDREEQTTLARLRRHLESLLASYADDLSFIEQCIIVYESRFATWRNSSTADLDSLTHEWSHLIEHSYPLLIEKISNDFVGNTPQTEKVLFEMLSSMRKRLLNTNHQGISQRSSVVSL